MKNMIKKTYESPRMKVMPIADNNIMCASGSEYVAPEEAGAATNGESADGKFNFKFLD